MSGELSLEKNAHITWKVPDFFNLPRRHCYFIESSQFFLADDPHCLRLYPNFWKVKNDSPQYYVAFDLVTFPSYVSERDDRFQIGYKSVTGHEFAAELEVVSLYSGASIFQYTACRSMFESESETYVPGGTLTVFCRMNLDVLESSRWQSVLGETSFVDRAVALHEGDYGVLPSMSKLQTDYEHLLLKVEESEMCLMVCGKEFKVHRIILRARSPVFSAMFGHETLEKQSGTVVIDDLYPDSFPEFLEYVYTGRVKTLSNNNVFGVYMAADKYQLHTLKSVCVEYMRKNISVNSFCDAMTLALQHNEIDLMAQVVQFFKKYLDHIISTVKWQRFMIENSTRVNELLLKAFDPGEQ